MLRVTIVALLLIGSAIASGQELPVLDITGLEHQTLRSPVEYLQTDNGISLQTLQNSGLLDGFTELQDGDVNQGVSGDSYWLRVRLQNSGSQARSWVLHHETSYLDHMTFYVADAGEDFSEFRQSDRRPFFSRFLDYRKLGYSYTTAPGSHTDLYVRIEYEAGKADAMSLNFHLWDSATFSVRQAKENLLFGLFYGNSLTLMVISLVMVVMLRQRAYAYYFLLVASTAVFWLHLNGFGFQYIWPDQLYWHNEGFHITYLGLSVIAWQFSRVFLSTADIVPRIDRAIGWLLWLGLAGIVLRLFDVYVPVLYMAAFYLGSLALLPVLGLLCYRKGIRHAQWFTVAWTIYGLMVILGLLSAYTQVLVWGMGPLMLTQIGSVVENVLLLIATAKRVMSLEQERRDAIALANTDPLTGLGNRRLLSRQYALMKDSFRRSDKPVFLILMDLDYFKELNDTHGHSAGDRVLVNFAELLQFLSRSTDVCVRFGGEEFAILMQADNIDAAAQFAERIRQAYASTPTIYRGTVIKSTLSAGVATVFDETHSLSEREMIASADEALYRAKAGGRNCIVVGGNSDTQ